jgi:hypothetical protein
LSNDIVVDYGDSAVTNQFQAPLDDKSSVADKLHNAFLRPHLRRLLLLFFPRTLTFLKPLTMSGKSVLQSNWYSIYDNNTDNRPTPHFYHH